jgi:hypothetical protein
MGAAGGGKLEIKTVESPHDRVIGLAVGPSLV